MSQEVLGRNCLPLSLILHSWLHNSRNGSHGIRSAGFIFLTGKKKTASTTYWRDLILCLQSAAVHPVCRMTLSISPSPTAWRAASSLISNRLTSWSGGERLVMGSCIKGTDNKASIGRPCSKIPERILKSPSDENKSLFLFLFFTL